MTDRAVPERAGSFDRAAGSAVVAPRAGRFRSACPTRIQIWNPSGERFASEHGHVGDRSVHRRCHRAAPGFRRPCAGRRGRRDRARRQRTSRPTNGGNAIRPGMVEMDESVLHRSRGGRCRSRGRLVDRVNDRQMVGHHALNGSPDRWWNSIDASPTRAAISSGLCIGPKWPR